MNVLFHPMQIFLLALLLGFIGGFTWAGNFSRLMSAPTADTLPCPDGIDCRV